MTTSYRIAKKHDRAKISSFLRSHWRSDHVFLTNPELMVWQHGNSDRGDLNFVLAEARDTIVGILGFISFRTYDPSLPEESIALAIWKRTDHAPRGTGLGMLTWLIDLVSPSTVIAINLNPATRHIYESLGFTTGTMSHYVLFNSNRLTSTVTGQTVRQPESIGAGLEIIEHSKAIGLSEASGLEKLLARNYPQKSLTYFVQRFENHPWFEYEFVTLGEGSVSSVLLVLRKISVEGESVLRVVDIAGDVRRMPESATALSSLVTETGSEYVDVLVHGLDETEMVRHGFQSRESNPALIVPNYFDPFERRNIDVLFAYSRKDPMDVPFHLHPADSDQDRPNR